MQGRDRERWQRLCVQAAVEQDPDKFADITKEINDLLGDKGRRLKRDELSKARAASLASGSGPIFDVFAGASDRDARWVEAVRGLGSANDRMHQIAAAAPGEYFLFSRKTRRVMARVQTSVDKPSKRGSRGNVA